VVKDRTNHSRQYTLFNNVVSTTGEFPIIQNISGWFMVGIFKVRYFLGSSVNVLDDGAVLLLFKFWTSSIVSLFLNHYVSREGSSLVLRCTYSGGSGRWS
jgi:hypothetical protein